MTGPRLSIVPAGAVADQRLGKAAFRVLAALGIYADANGRCWPSVKTIAAKLGITRQAIQPHLRELENLKYIETEKRPGQSSRYRIIHGNYSTNGVQAQLAGGAKVALAGGVKVALAHNDSKNDPNNDNGAFNIFWASYPSRKPHSNPKPTAAKIYKAAVKNGAEPEAINRGAENYALYVAAENIDPRFVKQAATFLNQKTWTEYQEAPKPKPDGWAGSL